MGLTCERKIINHEASRAVYQMTRACTVPCKMVVKCTGVVGGLCD